MIPNPWVILAVVLAWLGSVTAVGLWQRHDGAASTKAAYEARDNKALSDANALILTLENKNRAIEQEHAEQIAAIGEAHEKDRNALEARRLRDIADARSGALVLRDPGAKPAACPSAVSGPATAPGVSDGPAGGELSQQLTEFLASEASRADAIVADLGGCQAVVRADRQTKE